MPLQAESLLKRWRGGESTPRPPRWTCWMPLSRAATGSALTLGTRPCGLAARWIRAMPAGQQAQHQVG